MNNFVANCWWNRLPEIGRWAIDVRFSEWYLFSEGFYTLVKSAPDVSEISPWSYFSYNVDLCIRTLQSTFLDNRYVKLYGHDGEQYYSRIYKQATQLYDFVLFSRISISRQIIMKLVENH